MALTSLSYADILSTFNQWALTYDGDVATSSWGFEGYCVGLNWIRSCVAETKRFGRVVDLGCGTAKIADELWQLGCSIEYVGVDLSPAMLSIAEKKRSVSEVVQTDMRCLDKWRYLVATETCNDVISTYALHHINDEEKVSIIRSAFAANPLPDFRFLVVDYGFRNSTEREQTLRELSSVGRVDIASEIESECYADLANVRDMAMTAGLKMTYEQNGPWDWRFAFVRASANR
jgi:SAM-dependent methyltransferase